MSIYGEFYKIFSKVESNIFFLNPTDFNMQWWIPLDIAFASNITVYNLVFCKTINSKEPEIFTIPSMLKSPTSGKSLFNAIPGLRGLFSISTCPTLSTTPKQASMAIIKGFLCFDLIIFTVSFKFPAWTVSSNVPYMKLLFLLKNLIYSPINGPRASPVERSDPMHIKTIGLFSFITGESSLQR